MDISEKENEREGQGDQPAEGLPEEAWTWGKKCNSTTMECSTDGTTVVLIVYSAPDQVMQTAEELMARPFLAEKVSKGKFPQVSLSLQWYKCFGQR